MNRIIPILILLAIYLALTPKVDGAQIIFGLVIALVVIGLLRPKRWSVRWTRLPSAVVATVVYVGILVYDVIQSGLQVMRIVLHPKMPLKSGIIAFPAESHSETGRALGAHAISLPPGEQLIEMAEDGTMYIHSLDVETSERLVTASQSRRKRLLQRIFDA